MARPAHPHALNRRLRSPEARNCKVCALHIPDVENLTVASLFTQTLAEEQLHVALGASRPLRRMTSVSALGASLISVTLRNLALLSVLHLHINVRIRSNFFKSLACPSKESPFGCSALDSQHTRPHLFLFFQRRQSTSPQGIGVSH